MSKKILFPFSSDKDFNRGYSWTMELAVRMNAKLFFFTSVPVAEKGDAGRMQNIYHSLLEARGNYLQSSFDSTKQTVLAKTERCIEKGDFNWSLLRFVKKTKFDIVVVDPQASLLSAATLQDVVENSEGVIVLPDQPTVMPTRQETGKRTVTDFYDILRQSEMHKLPGNFFRTLGQDKNIFNYLRSFFKKDRNLHLQ